MKLLKLLTLLFLFNSCSNYIRVISSKTAPNEQAMQTRVFEFPADTLALQFFGDYRFDTLDHRYITLTSKEARKIISKNLPVKDAIQFTFAYTDLPEHYTMFGFYYDSRTLENIAALYRGAPYKKQYSSIMYVSEFSGYVTADVFRETEGGVARFITIYKPANEKSREAFIDREIVELYFIRS